MGKCHRLIWDDQNITHVARHEVIPDEVEQVAFSSKSHVRRAKGQNIYYLFGQTNAGRHLFIVLKYQGGGVGEVVTARDMSGKEKRWYRQHRREK